jgi:hypothetical protein
VKEGSLACDFSHYRNALKVKAEIELPGTPNKENQHSFATCMGKAEKNIKLDENYLWRQNQRIFCTQRH